MYYFKMIVPGTAGSTSHMPDFCIWHIPVAVTMNFCTIRQIYVFQICKMCLIKAPEFFKQIFSVNCGSEEPREP